MWRNPDVLAREKRYPGRRGVTDTAKESVNAEPNDGAFATRNPSLAPPLKHTCGVPAFPKRLTNEGAAVVAVVAVVIVAVVAVVAVVSGHCCKQMGALVDSHTR